MPEPIVYMDHSEIREGKLLELKRAMSNLAEFVESNEPRIFAYNVFFSEDDTRMTVIHIHPDSASLEYHMNVAGPEFPKFAEFIKLLSIDVYGNPGKDLVERLLQKAQMLGSGTVLVHNLHSGFARLGAP